MRVGIISVFVDFHRRGAHKRGVLQPQVGPLIAGCLPHDAEIEIINDSWNDPDFTRDYDLLFISALHPDFDRARQLSHYWRRRGAKTVFGGSMASQFAALCQPFFDAVVIGDAEGSVRQVYDDFVQGALRPVYVSPAYDPARVPVPRFDLMADAQLLPLTLEASRGCPFACDFCILSGIGTRYHSRPVKDVMRDIRAAIEQTSGRTRWWEWHKRNTVGFMDNNLAGDPAWLRELADAMGSMGLFWGGPITFNALRDSDLVRHLGRSGCVVLYTGLETFNPETLADMRKHQNVLAEARRVTDECREAGILLDTGLMLSPVTDTIDYIRRIPELLVASGIHVPTFVAIESPIPGTPHFKRLAAAETPAFLPNALLRDFSGFTLVTRPQRASIEEFIAGYRWLCDAAGSRRARLRKFAHDLPRFLARGHLVGALTDIMDHGIDVVDFIPDADRTCLAGTDKAPPEEGRIPFTADDFDSEEHRASICEPWRVTDEEGRVRPEWLGSERVFLGRGRINARLQEAAAVAGVC